MRPLRLSSLLGFALVAAACGDDGSTDDSPRSDGMVAQPDGGAIDLGTGPRTCDDPGGTLGDPCTIASDCNDGCVCNGVEVCTAGVCAAGTPPCDDGQSCTTDSCDESIQQCVYTADDAACDDGDLCNGAEICVSGLGCRPGLRPSCSDGDPCTVGRCDPDEGCVFEIRDLDGDGYPDDRCGGSDCLDDPELGANVYPGQPEICDNGIDDNCNSRLDYREPSCLGQNGTCATAEALPGPGTWVRSTRGLANDLSIGCRPSGLDAVFTFNLPTNQDVVVVLETENGSGAVAIRPLADCASASTDAYCESGNDFSTLEARDVPAGDYALIVKTSVATSYSLTLSYLPATPVLPVDVCNAETIDVSAGGTFTGLFSDVGDDYELDCRTPSATQVRKDVAYRLEITSPKDVEITASTRSSTNVSTYLSLVRDCANPATSLSCVQSRPASISRRALEPGVYYILMESSSTSAVSWELNVNIMDALPRNEGDACSTAVDITDAMATIPLSALELDYGTGCGGDSSSSRDGSFSFTLTETRDVVIETMVGAVHYLSVSTECGNPATELLCTNGTPNLSPRLLRLPAGTYYVTVSTTLTSGNIVVGARTEAPTFPPTNDECSGAIELTPAVDSRGTFLGAGDAGTFCGNAGSVDVFYRLVLAERQNVTLVARRTDGVGEPLSMTLLDGTCAVPGTQQCATGTPALLNRTLDPGTYLVILETLASFPSTYAVTAFTADP